MNEKSQGIQEIKEKIIERRSPTQSKEKEIKKISKEIMDLIEKELAIEAKPMIVGSVSKGTFLENPDIDIFVKFPLSFSRDEMEERILDLGEKILEDTKEKYAEHPYIFGKYDGYEVDIVPCYDIEDISQMKSAVDRTPFHTEYIKENMGEKEKKEAKVLKAFLKGIGAYGAEAKVWGFSGYLCELLILRYGSFEELIKKAKEWKTGKKIEMVEGKKEFDDPLIVIDPIDLKRNVASPVSTEKFGLFVLSSKRFLEEPKMSFFFPEERKIKSKNSLSKIIEKRNTDLMGIKIQKPDVVEDNLYPQVQKCERKLTHQLSHHDFNILHSDHFVKEGEILFLMEVETSKLPNIKKHKGPPVWVKNSEDFTDKYGEEVYLEEDRLWVDKKRKYNDLEQTTISISEKLSLGSDIDQYFPDKCKILREKELIKKEKRSLTEFFDRRFPWEL